MNLQIVGTCGYDLLSRVVLEVDLSTSTAACLIRQDIADKRRLGTSRIQSENPVRPCSI